MFNKLYASIKKYIKENYKFLMTLLILFIILSYPVPYYIYNGGGTIDISDRIEIDNKTNDQNFFMCYVGQMKANLMTLGMSYIFPKIDREEIENKDYNMEKEKIINDILLEESKSNAIINAFTMAGKNINIKKEKLYITHIYEEANTNLEVGDMIISINDNKVNSMSELKQFISLYNENEEVSLKIKNFKNKEMNKKARIVNISSEKKLGIGLSINYEYEIPDDINIEFKGNETGPSGGFMMSLAIYDNIANLNLSTDKKVCGTGTISSNGEIGEIGGVKYKLMGAEEDGCNIFLVPSGDNYDEAIKEKKKNKYDIEIYEAKTFLDTVSYLKMYK